MKSDQLADARYSFDSEKLATLRKEAPWTKETKYFQKVALSPSAIMKMMMHCQSGVTKGIKKGGNPIEVMGMLLGRPDPDTPRTLVVTDAFPLPIEGFETRVIADDADVVNHMISLGECLERTRKEKFMGWYHSHPFDLGDHSHCFLSQTDLSTQLQWQRAEDPHGNPFVAIVVDPLRSLHKALPELKAFRAYPPEYNSPVENECPNGSVEHSEQTRLELWGSCWNRYYELGIEYFMSSHARHVMEHLTQDYLWMRTLGTTTPDSEERKKLPEKIGQATAQLQQHGSSSSESKGYTAFRSGRAAGSSPTGSFQKSGSGESSEELEKAVQQIVDLSTEQLRGAALDNAKRQLFSSPKP
eukprot:CAMPEP_0116839992 /NCGR_PEP_ID=MMETSP0418-20121206/10082_1 /TAXON_ID=1158023 /ORGANISM="Astrosyne radiata, Strain 13vi08-1A" /LENGTH=356 /DNA_ID=CAMNT_0004470179 /DNA_START=6 /DNA_END=1076 /DNA_ORIENTATION=+